MDNRNYIAPGFEKVYDVFISHFEQGLEQGAAFCVYHHGELILDLWAGSKDRKGEHPWERETLAPVFSVSKGLSSLLLALLVEEGELDYDQPVKDIWPEFTGYGKEHLTLAQLLSHQAGLSGFRIPVDWFETRAVVRRLEEMEPWWTPGTYSGYHPISWGSLAGEMVVRATGQSLGTLWRERLSKPYNLDVHLGLPRQEHGRICDILKPKQPPRLGEITPEKRAAFLEPWSSPGRGQHLTAWREAEFPAANGHGTARGIAEAFSMISTGGFLKGQKILSPQTLHALTQVRREGADRILPFTLSWGAGILRNTPHFFYGPGTKTVGHSGWGGSCVFADPERNISAAYVMNQQIFTPFR